MATFDKLVPSLYERQLNLKIEMEILTKMKKVQDDMQKSFFDQFEK